MLAGGFLSAKKLGLKAKERQALVEVLEGLERGWFMHSYPDDDLGYDIGLAFNMTDFDCGTTACIAGWCDVLYQTKFARKMDKFGRPGSKHCNLEDLFFARGAEAIDFEDITPKQAAMALRNYLSTGKPHWGMVVEDKPHGQLEKHRHRTDEDGEVDSQDEAELAEIGLCTAG